MVVGFLSRVGELRTEKVIHVAQSRNIWDTNDGPDVSAGNLSAEKNRGRTRRCIHRGEAQDPSDKNLRLPAHMQVSDNKDWKEPEGPICEGVHDGTNISGIDDGARAHAASSGNRPVVRDRSALDAADNQIDEAKHDSAQHQKPESPDMNRSHGDTQEENPNRDLEHAGNDNIQQLTYYPVLSIHISWNLGGRAFNGSYVWIIP